MSRPATELSALVNDTRQLLRRFQAQGVTTLRNPLGTKGQTLEPLRRKAMRCQLCSLCKARNRVVFGEGSWDAPIVFVGEGPGREEDLQGRPFVGAAGGLLNRMIEAMGLRRDAVYIANVVKCRPPENRVPQPEEIAACLPYLETQLKTIRPRVICALGRTAASALQQTDAPLQALRGKTLEWNGIPLIVTFHPAYLLRNPSAKKPAWEDLQRVLDLLR